MSEKKCPVCNVELTKKSEGYAMGSPLSFNRFHADIYTCPKCNSVYLFENEKDLMVTCPVCGTQHHKGEECLICALNKVSEANVIN